METLPNEAWSCWYGGSVQQKGGRVDRRVGESTSKGGCEGFNGRVEGLSESGRSKGK